MRTRNLLWIPVALGAALVVAAAAGDRAGDQVRKPQQAQPASAQAQPVPAAAPAQPAPGTPAAAPAQAPVVLGKSETAKWTPTTWESATSEAHKKVLESGKVATVTGEVVDVSCYLQLGKRGEAHIPCGTKCIANGQPIGIVDAGDNLHIVMAEEHHPRRDGEVELKSVFGPLLAKTVTTTGMMVEMKGYRALFVQAAELGGAVKKPAAAPAK